MKNLLTIAALVLVTACASHQLESDSKSNWLRDCLSRQDCPTDAACVCGVCTKVCDNTEACSSLSDQHAVCVDPSEQGLPACSSDPVTDSRICLLACTQSTECSAAQRCTRGVCISAALSDAGMSPPNTDVPDAKPPITGNPGLDGGGTSPPPVTQLDAGKTNMVPPLPDPDDDAGLVACRCPTTLVCDISGSCETKGVDTLTASFPLLGLLYAADADYVYGVEYINQKGKGRLMRWPTRGGKGQRLAQEAVFEFGAPRASFAIVDANSASTQPPLIVDGQRLYFLAAVDASDLSASLWSMPKDDSQVPTQHGYAGSVIAQDDEYLYFSNDGDSRVLRTGKATLATSNQREEIYRSTSDAPLTILLLAVNSTSLFVTELPPNAEERKTYSVVRVAKSDAAKTSIGTNDRFTSSAWHTFADDTYFTLGGPEGAARLDLATSEVKPLAQGYPWIWMSFAGGALYGASGGGGPDGFWVVDLATARRTSLASADLLVTTNVAVPGAVYAVLSPPRSLLRIPLP